MPETPAAAPHPGSTAVAERILAVLAARDPAKSVCPSEVARSLDPEDWRTLMVPVREAAARLADRGRIEATQKGEVVDVRSARGPIRLVKGPRWDSASLGD